MKNLIKITLVSIIGFLLLGVGFSSNVFAFDPFAVNGDPTVCSQAGTDGQLSPVCEKQTNPNPLFGPNGLITKIANIFALITGVAAVVVIMVGGFEYVRSGGESAKVNKAKNTILFAVIGLVVVVLARTIVIFVLNRL